MRRCRGEVVPDTCGQAALVVVLACATQNSPASPPLVDSLDAHVARAAARHEHRPPELRPLSLLARAEPRQNARAGQREAEHDKKGVEAQREDDGVPGEPADAAAAVGTARPALLRRRRHVQKGFDAGSRVGAHVPPKEWDVLGMHAATAAEWPAVDVRRVAGGALGGDGAHVEDALVTPRADKPDVQGG